MAAFGVCADSTTESVSQAPYSMHTHTPQIAMANSSTCRDHLNCCIMSNVGSRKPCKVFWENGDREVLTREVHE